MADAHTHEQTIRYTVHLDDRHWWGAQKTVTVIGKGSSVQGSELLIHTESGLYSFNFGRVLYMEAEELDGHGHA